MDLSGIISIAGKPGLFKVLAKAKNNIIVESLSDGKKSPAYSTDRISALEDISIYTHEEDIPLEEVLQGIFDKENGGKAPSHKESLDKLTNYLLEVLPNYDEDRVYASDIKKIFQWYNLLLDVGVLNKGKEVDEKKSEDNKKETTKKTTPAKQTKVKTPTNKTTPTKGGASTKKTSAKKNTTTKATATKKK